MSADEFHSITELARDLGVTARTIRFYEDKGLIAPRRAGATRVYTQRDRARMVLILRGKRLGFSLRDIKDYLDLYRRDATGAAQLRLLLRGVADRTLLLEQQRAALDEALSELHDIRAQAEAALAATIDEPAAPAKRRKVA
jgi:DNA-binding transcriptional MerR regulator